ncbi:hypothetical protein [Pseudorhizobium banfieldiae]|nr:hypothetical protein [Pseudorhizobium banfieldiae]
MAEKSIMPLQKPMCVPLKEADELVAAEAYDRPMKIFENFIFNPPVLKARNLIDEGAIGTPISIRMKSNPVRRPTAWQVPPLISTPPQLHRLTRSWTGTTLRSN